MIQTAEMAICSPVLLATKAKNYSKAFLNRGSGCVVNEGTILNLSTAVQKPVTVLSLGISLYTSLESRFLTSRRHPFSFCLSLSACVHVGVNECMFASKCTEVSVKTRAIIRYHSSVAVHLVSFFKQGILLA